MPIAFSYLRFSSPQQAAGDSIRRQTEATADWCQRHKATLDESLNLRDEGVSAFKGKHRENPDVHGLAAFLAAVKTGRVSRGAILVVENLDRLSRESIVPAVNLFTGILMSGVKIVQLKPHEQTFDAGADMTAVMLALVELSRGNSESQMKSERVGAAWSNKRKNAATKVVTSRTPVWIDNADGKLVLDRDKAKMVKLMFRMVREGFGLSAVAKHLNKKRISLLGRTTFKGKTVVWSAGTVWKIVTSRACIGEYQPHRGIPGNREPSGPLLRDYYPAVVTTEEFAAAQASLRIRNSVGRGRRGKHVNLFSGLLRDARTGSTLSARYSPTHAPVLFPLDGVHGRGKRWVCYPLAAFEEAILSRLIEVKLEDVQAESPMVDRVEMLAARLVELEALETKWRAKMDRPELVNTVADKLTDFARERREVEERLADAQRETATPLADALKRIRTVGKALATDNSDENRERCRSAIHRAVESIHCLFMPGRGTRHAAVSVRFRSGAQRDYLIATEPARGIARYGKRSEWSVESFAEAGLSDTLDLRKLEHAQRLEKAISRAVEKPRRPRARATAE